MKKTIILILLIALVYTHIVFAALLFTNAVSDRVNCGSSATIDNVNTGTIMAWVYATSITTADRLLQKALFPNSMSIQGAVASTYQLTLDRATQSLLVLAPTANMAGVGTNKWFFMAFVYTSAGVDGDQHIYSGDQTTVAIEATGYTTQRVGSGAVRDDSASDLIIGNNQNNALAWQGRIAWVGWWNRAMALQEIQTQQFSPKITTGCILFTHLGLVGTGTQPDLSGIGNHGTITGATQADHPPMVLLPWSGARKSLTR